MEQKSHFFAKKLKKVICIEPTPSCVRRLNKLKNILSFSNLEIIPVAAGKYATEMKFLLNESSDANNRLSINNIEKNSSEITIKVETLTEILKKQGIKEIDYCKINIEVKK